MRGRILAVVLSLTLLVSVFAAGCGSSGSSGYSHRRGHHAVLKSVGAAVIAHHLLKKHGQKHALIKSLAVGGVVHHFVKKK